MKAQEDNNVQFSGADLKAQLADVFGFGAGSGDEDDQEEALHDVHASSKQAPGQRFGLGAEDDEIKTRDSDSKGGEPARKGLLEKLADRSKRQAQNKKRRQPTSAFEGVASELRAWDGSDDDDDDLGLNKAAAVKTRKRIRVDPLESLIQQDAKKEGGSSADIDTTASAAATSGEDGQSKSTLRNRRRREKKKQAAKESKIAQPSTNETEETNQAKEEPEKESNLAGKSSDVNKKSKNSATDKMIKTDDDAEHEQFSGPRDPTAPMQPSWPRDKTRRKKKRSKQKNLKKDTRPVGTFIKTYNKYKE